MVAVPAGAYGGLTHYYAPRVAVLEKQDEQGNWCLKGLPWEQLHVGQVITTEVSEKLYGALWKLMEYEDTGLSPEAVEKLNTFDGS